MTDPKRPATVTEEHRKLADKLCEWHSSFDRVYTAQLLANHDARVEARARLAEAKWWADGHHGGTLTKTIVTADVELQFGSCKKCQRIREISEALGE